MPTPHIQPVPLLIEVCRIRSRFESEVPSLLMMTMSYLLSWDDILTLLDIDWTFWAPCWDPADSYVEVLDCKSFSPHDLSGTLYASNITFYMKSLDCNDDHFKCEQSGNAFMNHLHSSKCHLRQHYSPQNCPNKLYTDCSSMGPSPTYGCMRIFGRENPYICVIGTISGYIWQYICGRPYAVSGAAYSTSLLQGGPLIHQFSWRRSAEHCN